MRANRLAELLSGYANRFAARAFAHFQSAPTRARVGPFDIREFQHRVGNRYARFNPIRVIAKAIAVTIGDHEKQLFRAAEIHVHVNALSFSTTRNQRALINCFAFENFRRRGRIEQRHVFVFRVRHIRDPRNQIIPMI